MKSEICRRRKSPACHGGGYDEDIDTPLLPLTQSLLPISPYYNGLNNNNKHEHRAERPS